ncbi:metallopeptidase family protein [Demetria terragena]|uniref:metallopeptidase family protein n=1 Tax=Demetria terragena TaxID=63959 RepID=UPI000381B4D3
MRTRRDGFDELVLDALERVEHRVGQSLQQLEVAVEDIPPSDPAAWESAIPLGRLFPAEGRTAPRLVVYRRPVASRAAGEDELRMLVQAVVAEQVATLLGINPDDLEDGP